MGASQNELGLASQPSFMGGSRNELRLASQPSRECDAAHEFASGPYEYFFIARKFHRRCVPRHRLRRFRLNPHFCVITLRLDDVPSRPATNVRLGSGYCRAAGWHMESSVTSACRERRPDNTSGRELHADLRRGSSVDARGLQHVRQRVHFVWPDADSGTHSRVHAGGVPYYGVRVYLHACAQRR